MSPSQAQPRMRVLFGLVLFACLRVSGFNIAIWPGDDASVWAPPLNLTNVVAVSGGDGHAMFLRSDGTVVRWYGTFGEEMGVSNAAKIASGWCHDLAVMSNGTVVEWGLVLPNCGSTAPGTTMMPSGLSNIVAAAGGYEHSIVLKSDGTCESWGWMSVSAGYVPAGLSNVVAVAGGLDVSAALRADGTVANWGRTDYGGTGGNGLSGITAIALGHSHGLALRTNGTVAVWGGTVGAPPVTLTNVAKIGAKQQWACAFQADGTFIGWGTGGQVNGPSLPVTNVLQLAPMNWAGMLLVGDGPPQPLWKLSNQVALAESVVKFQGEAVGTEPLSYQWYFNGTNLPGATTPTLTLANTQPSQAGPYFVVASNAFGVRTNGGASLTVIPALFTSQPTNQTVYGGDNATLSVGAQGARLLYQWRLFGTNLPGETNAQLTLATVTTNHAGDYSVAITNDYGSIETSNATLTVIPVAISVPPTSQSRYVGDWVSFSVTAMKNGPFSYQWRHNGADLPGEINSWVQLFDLTTNHAGWYSVVVSNSYGSVESSGANLNVLNSAPIITSQPVSLGRYPGNSATFQVTADGSKPMTYRWRLNGTNLTGATSASLLLSNLTTAQAGNYSVLVSNSVGSTLSSNASLVFLTVVTWGGTNSYGLGRLPLSLTNVVGLCAGNSHSAALKSDGRVVAWGDNYWGQTNVPASVTNVVAIAAALNHTLALRSNGTVVSWGDMTIVPANVTNAVAIAAGDSHNVVLRADGTVSAWGTTLAGAATNVPAGLSNVVAVAGGGGFSAAVLADGRVIRWGSSISTTGMTNVASLSGGVFTLVALKGVGKVVASGTGTVPASLSNAVAVAAGRYNGLALKSDGTVTSWTSSPTAPAGLSNLTFIASGENHCLGLLASGPPLVTTKLMDRRVAPGSSVPFYSLAVGAWRLSYQWRLNGTNLPGATNAMLMLTNVLPGVHSGSYSVLVTNSLGSVTSSVALLEVADFGPALNTSNLVWTSSGDAPWFTETTNTHDGVAALQSGSVTNTQTSTVQTTVTGPGTLRFWWKVASGQLAFQGGSDASTSISGNVNWQQQTIYLGSGSRTLSWTFRNGIGAGWLDEVTFEPGATAPIFTSAPASQSQGPGFSLTLSGGASGTPPIGYQWQFSGTNVPGATFGSLAISNLHPANAGVYTLVATNVAGTNHADASVEIGQVAAWPTPSSGQPVVPAGMTNIIAIAQGKLHSLVLRADGTVQAWDNMSVPAGVTNIIAISSSAGAYHDVALRADGTVIAWGDNTRGNTWGQTDVPAGLSNVVAVAAGWYNCLALKSDGTVVAWGDVSEGQSVVPEGLTNVVGIGAGSFHSLAVQENGNVVVWGRSTNVPPDLTNAVAVAAGWFYCTAVRADGRVVTWGDNTYGQTNVPASLTNATRITSGWYHAFAATTEGGLAACDNSSTVPAGLSNVLAVASGYYNNLALLGAAPPPSQVAALLPTVDSNGFSVSLPTQSGRVYRLEYKNSLEDANWIALPLVPGNGAVQVLSDNTAIASQRFYRVRQW